jgi:hypothetical protein
MTGVRAVAAGSMVSDDPQPEGRPVQVPKVRASPLWARIADALRAGIRDGTFEPRRMPTARELAGRFGCGAEACRMALDELAAGGLITRLPLRGTVPADLAGCAALGGTLAVFRLAAGKTSFDLATATGYPATAIRDAESGRREFPPWLWLALDDALGAQGTLRLAHASYAAPVIPAASAPCVPDVGGGAAIAAELAKREAAAVVIVWNDGSVSSALCRVAGAGGEAAGVRSGGERC